MTAPMYVLLLVALLSANLPFVSGKWFGILTLPRKHFGHHLVELTAGFALVGILAYFLEAGSGNVHNQSWAFYVTVICLYLIFAFPAFVVRYFWHGKNRE